MATIVKVLGEQPKRCIEFVGVLNGTSFNNGAPEPKAFRNIELIAKDYFNAIVPGRNIPKYDLMFAYSTERKRGQLIFGYFNDGIVAE